MPVAGTRRFTFEYKSAGQPRPYADSIYDFTVTCEWIPYAKGKSPNDKTRTDWVPNDLPEKRFTEMARVFNPWLDNPKWYEPHLMSVTQIDCGIWRYVITEVYTD